MAQATELAVTPRTVVGKATKRLRKTGVIPANIYGHKEASIAVQIDAHTFDRLRREHGLRNIVSLRLPGEKGTQTVLVRNIQYDSISGKILHVDFSRVSMQERIEMKIPLHFIGEAPGVKLHGGVVLHLLEALPVECKASDIIDAIEVDLSPLTEIDSMVYARDVKLPAGYKLAVDADDAIVKLTPPRIEVPEAEVAT
ncbi:MAG TPA: 50S ribosomal protein L25, partial [Ktedonobacteraceae bacterium]|nr:50S ribosomal protein L25 [Ktedonobacteraceae bacterium]